MSINDHVLTLHTVVNDVAQTVEGLVTGAKFFLGFLDSGGHAETEATAKRISLCH